MMHIPLKNLQTLSLNYHYLYLFQESGMCVCFAPMYAHKKICLF